MAWDALAGQFSKPKTKEVEDLWGQRAQTGGVGGVGSQVAPQALPTGGFGGTAGSSDGAPTSKFVNYGTLYGLNEEKAKQMASNVYRGAEGKAEGAKDALSKAQNQFNQGSQVHSGLVAGPHGTRIEDFGTAQPAKPKPKEEEKHGTAAEGGEGSHIEASPDPWAGPIHNDTRPPAHFLQSEGTGNVVIDTTQRDAEDLQADKDASVRRNTRANRLASRYSGLLGDMGEAQTSHVDGLAMPKDEAALSDYHHTVSSGQANANAAAGYEGYDSLKDSMGDAGYASLGEQFRTADEAVKGTETAEGLAEALGYAGSNSGSAAMDAGLTQTAGQANFKKLRDRYSGLSKLLPTAQSDSLATVGRAKAEAEANADTWKQMMDDYTEATRRTEAPEDGPKPGDPLHTADMNAWAVFVGAGNPASSGINNTLSSVGLEPQRAYNTMKEMGYTNDQIYAAFMEWRRRHGNSANPTAAQLAQLIIEGVQK